MKMHKHFVLGLLLIFLAACSQTSYQDRETNKEDYGRVIFSITDAAAEMGSVSSVKVTVDKVLVNSETEGWVSVSDTQKTYDLLELKSEGKLEVLADSTLESGTYDQFRLDISKVIVVDEKGEHEAKLPSNELKIKGEIKVEGNKTSTATFDFIADESLHVTGNGMFIMAPVIKVETRDNAEVEIKEDNKVEITGGKVRTNAKVGMDVDGNVDVGLKIPLDVGLSISSSGIISVGSENRIDSEENQEIDTDLNVEVKNKARTILTITDAAANMGSVSSVKVTIDNVMVHNNANGWMTISSSSKTYDLMQLKTEEKQEILADALIEEGNYNQVRLDISKVIVVDEKGEHEAKLPSNELKITAQINAKKNSNATATFDFIVDESLHVTGDGKYIMAPVIKVETREDAQVVIREDNSVGITSGKIITNQKVGMNLKGFIAAGTKIAVASKLTVDAEGKIRLG